MSKQSVLISIIIVVSLVVGGLSGWYFYLRQQGGIDTAATPTEKPREGGFFGLGSTKTPSTNSTTTVSSPSDEATSTPVVTVTVPRPIPDLRHLTIAPVAGAAFIDKDVLAISTSTVGTSTKTTSKVVGSVEVFRWIDRATGNIYETSSSTLETIRISNVTVPRIYEAYFVDRKGSTVLFRDLIGDSDAIRTRYGILRPETATSTQLTFKFTDLPLNITQLAISPTSDQIFSILPTNVRGTISKPDGGSSTNVFNSQFHEWLVSWPSAQTVVLNTKPSGTAPGYAYIFNTKTRALSKLVGNRDGLTTLVSPDGNNVLVGESPLATIKLSVLNRQTGIIKDLFVRTFPEKCVWSKKDKNVVYCAIPDDISYGVYPDAWYIGTISFSDSLWKIDIGTGEIRQLVQPATKIGQSLDMVNLTLSKKEDFVTFQDKNDLSLWSYQLVKPIIAPVATSTATTTPTR